MTVFVSTCSPPRGRGVCLNPRMPAVSHPTPDRLVALLPGPADADRPWLVNYSPGSERIELTGHVLNMWASKSAGLLTNYEIGRASCRERV